MYKGLVYFTAKSYTVDILQPCFKQSNGCKPIVMDIYRIAETQQGDMLSQYICLSLPLNMQHHCFVDITMLQFLNIVCVGTYVC